MKSAEKVLEEERYKERCNAYPGYRMVYELDAYNCTAFCGWLPITKMKNVEYNSKYGKDNIKTYLQYGRYWQIYIKEEVFCSKVQNGD